MKMESSIKAQKLEAMKNHKRAQFLFTLVVYFLTAFLSCLFYLYLFWFPSTSSANHLLSVLVLNIYSFFLSSPNKLLFIVGNLIVLFLVGESKLAASGGAQYSSPADEIYDEYARRSRSLRERSLTGTEHKKKDAKAVLEMHTFEHKKKGMEMEKRRFSCDAGCSTAAKKKLEKLVKVREGTNHKNDIDQGEAVKQEVVSSIKAQEENHDDIALPREELNRRVEDFIARVNRQRMLEERQVVLDRS